MHKEAGRPIPRFCEDDVVDFMVMEAIAVKIRKEEEDEAKEQKKKKWKGNTDSLNQYR